jgi:hypothetical protein
LLPPGIVEESSHVLVVVGQIIEVFDSVVSIQEDPAQIDLSLWDHMMRWQGR